jgi:phospholipase D-like protein
MPAPISNAWFESGGLEMTPSIDGWVIAVIAVIAAVEILLDVYALFDLWRTPAERVTTNKWIWAVIILLVNPLGAILYLVIGRKPAPAADHDTQVQTAPRRNNEIVDSLYGPPKPQR